MILFAGWVKTIYLPRACISRLPYESISEDKPYGFHCFCLHKADPIGFKVSSRAKCDSQVYKWIYYVIVYELCLWMKLFDILSYLPLTNTRHFYVLFFNNLFGSVHISLYTMIVAWDFYGSVCIHCVHL